MDNTELGGGQKGVWLKLNQDLVLGVRGVVCATIGNMHGKSAVRLVLTVSVLQADGFSPAVRLFPSA